MLPTKSTNQNINKTASVYENIITKTQKLFQDQGISQ
jgi:hypothetical protein